ncbi:uncharacterized protein LOC118181225 isoform X2 [Stegodyphus dumicola]|uniref:uncharacterized protein LOC118181225 isoform X2 n=1 Tax=Stegodyphus dumicola TaxID=202533 RepID=UPI0015B22430|nr:uncharacterized protein LOC118181225 isoform X2 [Stegodyphus dumicola]
MGDLPNLCKFWSIVISLFCYTILSSAESLSRNCTHGRVTFERTPGLQLPNKELDRLGPLEFLTKTSPTACYRKCLESDLCEGYFIDHEDQKCVLLRGESQVLPFKGPLEHSSAWSYHRKICLGGKPCHRQWAFDRIPGVQLFGYDDKPLSNIESRDDCLERCSVEESFVCRSARYDQLNRTCVLSRHDRRTAPEAFRRSLHRAEYLENQCITVRMHCEATSMTAIVKVITPFRGRLYALGHPYECYEVSVRANGEVALTMPLHGRTCGTKNLGNGTFVNSVVVQHHPFVLRSTDRRIDVACDYEEVQRKLRGGKQVLEGDLQSLTQVITGLAATPPVRLRVLNASGYEVRGVELGEQLYLKVEMLDEAVFGIFGSGLFARSGKGTETVMLIDDRGCPVEPSIFPALKKSEESKSLVAPFQAFKFASESTVKFQLTVSFCLDSCAPVKCEEDGSNEVHTSYGRRRKRSDSPVPSLELQSGDVVTDITMETPLFVVSSSKPQSPHSPSHQQKFTTPSEGIDTIQLSKKGLCLTRPVLYTVAVVASVAQVAFFGSCVLLLIFVRRCRRLRSQSSDYYRSSRSSVSSKQELCPRT